MQTSGVRLSFLLLLLPWLLACGSRVQTEFENSPALTVRDQAGLVSPALAATLDVHARAILAATGSRVAVLACRDLQGREPSAFVEEAFDAAPYFRGFPVGPGDLTGDEEKLRDLWRKRGILVLVSVEPRVISLRVGPDLQRCLDPETLFTMLEGEVYPLLLKKRTREGLVTTLAQLDRYLLQHRTEVQPLSSFRANVYGVLRELRLYGFPTWRVYYWLVFDPLLNTLVLTMKITGYSVWGVLLWLLGIHLLTRQDWVKHRAQALVSGVVLPWFGRRLAAEGDRRVSNGETVASVQQELGCRYAQMQGNCLIAGGWVAGLLKLGMGIPVWACLSLITFPFWDHVLTMRQHLWGWVASGLDSHSVFVLRHGFLWWTHPTSSAGLAFAAVFGAFFAVHRLIELGLTISVSELSDEQARSLRVPQVMLESCRFQLEHTNYVAGTLASLVLMPLAVSFLPLLLALYFLMQHVLQAVESLGALPALARLASPKGR